MITQLSEEATDFGSAVSERIATAGGVDLLRRAAEDPSLRSVFATEVLDPTGVWELNPAEDQMELEAAAAASRASGGFAFPYPVVERLVRTGHSGGTLLVSRDAKKVANHADLDLDWAAVDIVGQAHTITGHGDPLRTKLGTFSVDVAAEPIAGQHAPRTAALLNTLHSWWLLGLLQSALNGTIRYTGEREQFGRALRKFQGVSFQLADMSVEVRGLEELAKYTLWSVATTGDDGTALLDSLALRAAGLRAAATVLRSAQQLHGAMGLTNEVDVSWLSRASQSVRRLPEGEGRTVELLTGLIESDGFSGLPGGVGRSRHD